MGIELVTMLLIGCLLLLLALGLPVAFSLGSIALLFTILFWSPEAIYMAASYVFGVMDNFVLVAAPLFIFMGCILETSGIADDLYTMMHRWMGPLRGGLAMGTVGICTVFAAMAGISAAGTVTMGTVALPAMLQRKYDKSIAVGGILAGGALGILIPPSLIMILYGALTGVSVGRLFMGGVFPGLVLSAMFITYIGIRCFTRSELGPPLASEERADWRLKLISVRAVLLPMGIMVAVLGSIYTGVATPTEAAAVGVFGATISAIVYRKLSWKNLTQAADETLKLSAMIFFIVIAAGCFAGLYGAIGGADFVKNTMVALPVGKYGILIGIQLVVIVMGMFLEPVGITMISIPIFMPIIEALGFDPLWFGIIFVVNLEMSYLTPPVGMNLFFIKGVCPPEVTMGDIYRCVTPFVILQAVGLALIIIFPQIAVWLPSTMIE